MAVVMAATASRILEAILSTSLIVPLEIAKWVFVVLFVASTIGVIVGVYWEGDKFGKEKQHLGWLLLLGSLAAETAFGLFIFLSDGWISEIQSHEISSLETRLAARILAPTQRTDIADAVRQFSGIKAQVVTYPNNPESENLAGQVIAALHAAKWDLQPTNGELFGVVAGVHVTTNGYVCDAQGLQCSTDTPPEEEKAAAALVKALKDAGISAALSPAKGALQVNPVRIAIEVTIGIKP